MRTIAITNQKGGVGKTTTTVNLAGILAEHGKTVMLIDLDPQAHLTTFIGVNPQEVELTAHDVLTRGVPLKEALVEVRDRIQLLSSGLDLAAAEQELVSVVGRETILRDALRSYPDPCDFVLIDCPPSLGLLTLNALGAVKELIIPLQPHFLSLQGLSQLLESILLVNKRINCELKVSGLIFCMYDARLSLTTEIVADIDAFFAHQRERETPWQHAVIFKTRIRRNVKLAESPSYGQTITEYESGSIGAEDYRALAAEIMALKGETLPPRALTGAQAQLAAAQQAALAKTAVSNPGGQV